MTGIGVGAGRTRKRFGIVERRLRSFSKGDLVRYVGCCWFGDNKRWHIVDQAGVSREQYPTIWLAADEELIK